MILLVLSNHIPSVGFLITFFWNQFRPFAPGYCILYHTYLPLSSNPVRSMQNEIYCRPTTFVLAFTLN